ncbi:predicted protein [Naegleria gruberi]|uniref:Predicted protein n=1 Tax=Naegleria gruberi TaxID=5762 RepID=D2VRA6_NAEGR|nr:uncharacterized protein NAEGRDRAFT_71519 [Naegleria gruberi]EFC40573.1 predicted protein [Naegleria gruberi]|eukprot:XP_002673317.1 predicted protein [Naegleria gruberi strain NEG-M]
MAKLLLALLIIVISLVALLSVDNVVEAIVCQQNFEYPLYKQCGQPWSNDLFGRSSICYTGSLITSMSMALNGRKISSMNPGQLNSWAHTALKEWFDKWNDDDRALENALVHGLEKLGMKNTNYYPNNNWIGEMVTDLCKGKVVLLQVAKDDYNKYWTLATGFDETTFTVNNPAYSKTVFNAMEVKSAVVFEQINQEFMKYFDCHVEIVKL